MVRNFFKYIFTSRPQNLGEGLARVKNKFNAVGLDLLGIPGQRFYDTPCNNSVHIVSFKDRLKIAKVLSNAIDAKEYAKYYVGKTAEIVKSYVNKVGQNAKVVVLDRSVTTSKFAQIKPNGKYQFPKANDIFNHVEDGIQVPLMPQVKTTKSYHAKMISYPKAVSMGMKV